MATEGEVNVYCSGIVSGAATMLMHHGVPIEVAPAQATAWMRNMLTDPAFRLELEQTVDKILADETGPVAQGQWIKAFPVR